MKLEKMPKVEFSMKNHTRLIKAVISLEKAILNELFYKKFDYNPSL